MAIWKGNVLSVHSISEFICPDSAGQRGTTGHVEAIRRHFETGVSGGEAVLHAVETRPGRNAGETIVRVAASRDGTAADVAFLLLYAGRPPLYRPWVEVYGQTAEVRWPDGHTITFFDSPLERALLETIAAELGPGERIYVDCEGDAETRLGMNWGIPEPITRAGFILYTLGFTWFKAWYYPEGLREGGQKLQAEKPINPEAARRHWERWHRAIRRFLERGNTLPDHPYVTKAVERARRWLETYSEPP